MPAKKQPRRPSHREDESFPTYSVAEVCALLSVKPGTLRKKRIDGTGPKFIRTSARGIVYLRDSVHLWLRQHERRVQVSYAKLRRPGLKRRSTRADSSPPTSAPGARRNAARLTVISG